MDEQYDPNVLARSLDDEAKRYWAASLWVGGAVFVMGLLGIFWPDWSTAAAYVAALLTLLSFVLNQFFESSRAKAQELRRKLDLSDSFGWPINTDEYNDLLLRCSKWVKRQSKGRKPDGPYFDSKEPAGAKRALQNVRESAWWSEHLSEKMFHISSIVTYSLLLISIISLIATLAMVQYEVTKNLTVYSKIARAVTSLLMLAFSLNLIKLTISYYKFSKGSAKCKEAAIAQLKKNIRGLDDAIIRMYEYFIIRSTSPVLPTWVWKKHRDELNALYPFKEKVGAPDPPS
jgi:hypothetical protein